MREKQNLVCAGHAREFPTSKVLVVNVVCHIPQVGQVCLLREKNYKQLFNAIVYMYGANLYQHIPERKEVAVLKVFDVNDSPRIFAT